MTTLLFLHGTGVRDRELARTRDAIGAGLAKVITARPPAERPRTEIQVAGCYWGEIGAELQAGGDSFYFDEKNQHRTKRAGEPDLGAVTKEERELARWARLVDDPLYEIRLRELVPPSGPLGRLVSETIQDLPGSGPVQAALADDPELTRSFAAAVLAVTDADEFNEIFGDIRSTDEDNERMLARAVVAQWLVLAAEQGVSPSGARREQLLKVVQEAFGVAPDHGLAEVTDYLGTLAKSLARGVTLSPFGPLLRRGRRGGIEQFADVIYYQARGTGIRRAVRDRIKEFAEPVVLLAHSLGGIIAFDLLTAAPRDPGLDRVRLLVTVGSQVPLLYELDALAGLRYGSKPQPGFPPWVNIYDKRDLLAYGGERLFPRHCADVEVDTGAPFWPAHSAYWDTEDFYRQLATALRETGL